VEWDSICDNIKHSEIESILIIHACRASYEHTMTATNPCMQSFSSRFPVKDVEGCTRKAMAERN